MKSDLEIARQARPKPIKAIARKLGIKEKELFLYADCMAKVDLSVLERVKKRKNGKYIVVTAVTPTPLGEGKTVTTIGLAMALNRLGKLASVSLRQPSFGPLFGIKGGAAGGGHSQVLPTENVNLHLTGDIHAVGSAHNLAAAFLDNSVFKGNPLNIDPSSITWRRVIDISDRFLRNVKIGLGTSQDGIPRDSGFDITVASEVMAILALAKGLVDLRKRLGKIVLAMTKNGKPVTAEDLKVAGAMAVLLKDALKPNLLQTIEGTPCFVHTGPFANIAHGNSSVLADEMALKLSDYVVTESGFGADCGAEKFFDIKCRTSGLKPDCAVMVCSLRALKMHSLANLEKQIENVLIFGIPVVLAINKFATDTEKEIEVVIKKAEAAGAEGAFVSEAYPCGSKGALRLAKAVVKAAEKKSNFKFLYPLNWPIKKKIETIAAKMYGAARVEYQETAEKAIDLYTRLGYDKLPICMAKTHLSLSHDPNIKGRPQGFTLPVRDVRLASGAGFLIPLCGVLQAMPGLPKHPRGERIDIDKEGNIAGLI